MRILLIQRYFWPDVGLPPSMLRALAARLVRDGHEVTVLSSMPAGLYGGSVGTAPRREMIDGYNVVRVRLARPRKAKMAGRAIDIVVFASLAAGYVLLHGRKYDVVSVSSEPPVIFPAAVRAVTRIIRRPYVYHCQDLNPEAALLAGLLGEGWRKRLLARLDYANVRGASAVVVLSRDMAAALRARGLDCQNVTVINNFVVPDPREVPPLSPDLRKPDGVLRVLFAGNLGLLQGLDVVLEAARRLRSLPTIQFAFVGAGVRAGELKARASEMMDHSVVFYPDQTPSVVLRMMEEADLGLVTLAPGVYRVAFPGKTLSYMEAGCRILAVVEGESELAELIRAGEVGRTCRPADPVALAEAVLQEQARGPATDVDRARIRAVCDRHFGQDRALSLWSELYARLARSRGISV